VYHKAKCECCPLAGYQAVVIRGLTNVREWLDKRLKSRHSGVVDNIMSNLWNDYLAEDIIWARIICLALFAVAMFNLKSSFISFVWILIIFGLQDFVIGRIKAGRRRSNL